MGEIIDAPPACHACVAHGCQLVCDSPAWPDVAYPIPLTLQHVDDLAHVFVLPDCRRDEDGNYLDGRTAAEVEAAQAAWSAQYHAARMEV